MNSPSYPAGTFRTDPEPVFNRTRVTPMTSDKVESKPFLIRLGHVRTRTGLSRSTLYAYIREGRFPAPIPISDRCVAWVESEIDQWIADRIASRRP